MSLKMDFVERAAKGEPVASLCREFGISRQTGHKWLKRYEASGADGLEEQSRRPKSAPLATAEDIVMMVLEAREKHPRWGPRTLEPYLRRKLGDQTPSDRTIARILRRAGLVKKRRRRPIVNVIDRAPNVQSKAPNDVWTVDHKGSWRTQNGERCEPLTVRDAFSRFVLEAKIGCRTTKDVKAAFEALFRRYGRPSTIQVDNGTPFVAVTARGGFSSLSAWWVSLGIKLVRSRPACPQDNGGHERMHGDIAQAVEVTPAETSADQQRALSRWRQEFNHVRPHQALGGKTPAEVYKPKDRKLRAQPRPYVYPSHWRVAHVGKNGVIKVQGELYFISESLARRYVGLEPIGGLTWRIWFYEYDLGTINLVTSNAFDNIDYLSSKFRKTVNQIERVSA